MHKSDSHAAPLFTHSLTQVKQAALEAKAQACEEACANATESTPAVEEALRFYAETGDVAKLMVLLERQIVNVMAKDVVRDRSWW